MLTIRNIKVVFPTNPKLKGLYIIFTSDGNPISHENYLAHLELPLPVRYRDIWYSELEEFEINRIFPLNLPSFTYARLESVPKRNTNAFLELSYL